jgi:hypothetical protein
MLGRGTLRKFLYESLLIWTSNAAFSRPFKGFREDRGAAGLPGIASAVRPAIY